MLKTEEMVANVKPCRAVINSSTQNCHRLSLCHYQHWPKFAYWWLNHKKLISWLVGLAICRFVRKVSNPAETLPINTVIKAVAWLSAFCCFIFCLYRWLSNTKHKTQKSHREPFIMRGTISAHFQTCIITDNNVISRTWVVYMRMFQSLCFLSPCSDLLNCF